MNKLKLAGISLFTLGLCAFVAGDKLGIDPKSIDKDVSPRDDFYTYANGTWVKNNPVPAEETRWSSFDILREQNTQKIRTVIDEVAADKGAADGTINQKIRDFYLTAMDSAKAEKEGYQPLQPALEKINAIANKEQLFRTIGELQRAGVGNTFGFYVHRDLKKSDRHIMYLTQGGLSLPDRDYYLKDDDRFAMIRKQYVTHVTNMLSKIGHKNAAAEAKTILALETELARASMSRVDLRNEEKTYHPYTSAELIKTAPSVKWAAFFTATGAGIENPMSVNQPEFFKRLNKLTDSVPLTSWKTYLTWHTLTSAAEFMSSDFVNEDFDFYSRTLNGQEVMKPRWKRSVAMTEGALGEGIGQLYVKKYFSEESKQRVQAMVGNLLAVYKSRISNLAWMGEDTKHKALAKLASFSTKLAYPDKWRDYSKLTIARKSYLDNELNANRFGFDYMIAKLGKPVDKTEWVMTPQTVNAYYEPTLNEIVFPAAIMQPPFFYADADDAVNYGAIGAVIGHEISHGFDDQGSKYDGHGNMQDWWTTDDRSKFEERTQKLINQYNKFEALPGVNVNGELTLGENIADLGGLNVAYQAYQLSLKEKQRETIEGFTPEQRFFLAYAQVWKGNIKDEALRKRIMTDPHSPGMYRVLGIVSNMPEFYAAFDIKPGDKMYRDENERAVIW